MKKVVLDFGHGGIDSGATGHGYKEKDLVLKLGLYVKEILEYHNIKVHLTRDRDKYVSLKERTNFSNKINPDLFVSFHLNSATNINAKGLEVFSYPASKNGAAFSQKLLNELIDNKLYLANRGCKTANFHVLRETKSTAALPEFAFISNKNDIEFFINNFNRFAEVTAKAIVGFLGLEYNYSNNNLKPLEPSNMTSVPNKTNLLLLTEHIVLDYINRDNTNYVKIENAYFSIRELLEAMNLEIGYENGFITADITKEFSPGNNSIDILLLGNKISIDAIKIENNYYIKIDNKLVAIRSIFESFRLVVKWNNVKNMILVERG